MASSLKTLIEVNYTSIAPTYIIPNVNTQSDNIMKKSITATKANNIQLDSIPRKASTINSNWNGEH